MHNGPAGLPSARRAEAAVIRQPGHDGRSLHGPWEWPHPPPLAPPPSRFHRRQSDRKPQ